MPPSSDLTHTHPRQCTAACVCSLFTREPGQKVVCAWSGGRGSREGVVVTAGGQKGFTFSQSYPGCMALWQLLPPFPP